MKITDEVGQAKPEPGNATRFIWWLFTERNIFLLTPHILWLKYKWYTICGVDGLQQAYPWRTDGRLVKGVDLSLMGCDEW
jgi:hypothetical protein